MVRPVSPSPLRAFLAAETGAVTVDWTVLAAGTTGLGIALAAIYTDQILQLNYNVGANVQERDTRPSFAYVPYDPDVHETFATLFSTLTDEDLAQVSSWGNARRDNPPASTQEEVETFRDLDNAVTAVYGRRHESRGESAEYDQQALESIVVRLGLADASLLD